MKGRILTICKGSWESSNSDQYENSGLNKELKIVKTLPNQNPMDFEDEFSLS